MENNDFVKVNKDYLDLLQEEAEELNFYEAQDSDFKIIIVSSLRLTETDVDIKILSKDNYHIKIDGETYELNDNMLKEIKEFVTKDLETLIRYSLSQDKEYLKNNYLLGGTASTYIQIKYGNLIIKLEGQVVGEIKEYCNNFKEKVVDIITRKNPKITYEEYKKIFEKNDDGSFKNLIIPKDENFDELNLTGKLPESFTVDEVVRMKKYVNKMFNMVDKNTINEDIKNV